LIHNLDPFFVTEAFPFVAEDVSFPFVAEDVPFVEEDVSFPLVAEDFPSSEEDFFFYVNYLQIPTLSLLLSMALGKNY